MAWKKPMLPRQLTTGFIASSFNRLQKRELGETLKNLCAPLNEQYRKIKWNMIEMRNLFRLKIIDKFEKDDFQQQFDDARAVVSNDCKAFTDACEQVRDQVRSLEKAEDNEAAKAFLVEISEQADLLAQALSQETLESHLQTTYDEHMAHLNQQLEQRFKQVKTGIIRIVEGIKKVIELEFDASSDADTVNGAVTYGYGGINSVFKNYAVYLEKGIGEVDIETYKKDLEPLTKFSGDKSLYTFEAYSEFYERDNKVIIGEDTDAEDVKKHCITLLKAVRELPSRYKE